MDWTAILLALLSGTTVCGVVETVRYKRQNMTIKDSEATQSSVEAQKSEIELANVYRDEMLKMVQMVKDANDKNFSNQDQMMEKLTRMDERLEKIELRVSDIETYLNGNYHAWLAQNGK